MSEDIQTTDAQATDGETTTEDFNLDYDGAPASETDVQNLNATEPTSEVPADQVADPQNLAPTEQPTEESDIDSLRRQLAEANARLLQFEGQPAAQPKNLAEQPSAGSPSPAPAAPQTVPFPQQANEVSSLDFIGQEDHIHILEDRNSFNALLNKVATTAYNAAVMAAQDRILRQIPGVVETAANQQMQIKDIVGRFYATNKDLEPYKPAVSMAAIKLHNENPGMPLEEMLTKAAEETRKTLRLRPNTQARQRVPAQPVGGGRIGGDRTAQPSNISDQEQQILDLLF